MYTLKSFNLNKLSEGEEVIAVIHRNWFHIFRQYISLIVLLFVLVFGIAFLPKFFPVFSQLDNLKFLAFFENSSMLALWILGFLIWIDYYFDVWIITTERIINIEQKGMFVRIISELAYSRIQDITTEVTGLTPSILNYGDVFVQTAGEKERVVFRTVSDPAAIKNLIVAQQEKHAQTGRPF